MMSVRAGGHDGNGAFGKRWGVMRGGVPEAAPGPGKYRIRRVLGSPGSPAALSRVSAGLRPETLRPILSDGLPFSGASIHISAGWRKALANPTEMKSNRGTVIANLHGKTVRMNIAAGPGKIPAGYGAGSAEQEAPIP